MAQRSPKQSSDPKSEVRVPYPALARRAVAAIVLTVTVASCVGPAPASPAAAVETPQPSPSASVTGRPPATPWPWAQPTPTAIPEPECVAFDIERETQPYVLLHLVEEEEVEEAHGLNGSHRIGDQSFESGFWHQPSPGAARSVMSGEALVVESYLDDDGERPICLASLQVDAAPFSPLAVPPEPASLVHVASQAGKEVGAAALAFQAPAAPGDWVIRVMLEFDTNPGPSTQESFFRLHVDVPPPVVDGRAGAPVPCSKPGGADDPPGAFLSVDDGRWIKADGGGFTWRGTSASAPAPTGPRVDAPAGASVRIKVEDDVCAGWWAIDLAPRPAEEFDYREPISDLVPGYGPYDRQPGQANRFVLAPIPPGDWVVGAFLSFGTRRDHVFGQISSFWNVVVPG